MFRENDAVTDHLIFYQVIKTGSEMLVWWYVYKYENIDI